MAAIVRLVSSWAGSTNRKKCGHVLMLLGAAFSEPQPHGRTNPMKQSRQNKARDSI